jgi:hypothetical protein
MFASAASIRSSRTASARLSARFVSTGSKLSLRAVHGEADVLLGLVVELIGVLTLEQLTEVGDLAQRLGQVVRGDVGELLEVGIGPGELLAAFAQDQPGLLDALQFVGDARAHGVDVSSERSELGWSARRDLPAERSAGHHPGLFGEIVHRIEHLALQPTPQQVFAAQCQGRGDGRRNEAEQDGSASRSFGRVGCGVDVRDQRRAARADLVELRLPCEVVHQTGGPRVALTHLGDVLLGGLRAPGIGLGLESREVGEQVRSTGEQRVQLAFVFDLQPRVLAVRLQEQFPLSEDEPAQPGFLVDQVRQHPLAQRGRRLPPVDDLVPLVREAHEGIEQSREGQEQQDHERDEPAADTSPQRPRCKLR